MTKRKKAIVRRRIFLSVCAAVLIAAIVGVTMLINVISDALKVGEDKSTSSKGQSSSVTDTSSGDNASEEQNVIKEQPVTRGDYTLDASYSRLMLVNAENPLPENYNYGANLTTIPEKYHNGQLDQIDKDIWPYMQAMIEAAWKDGVQLYVWSPYRSYAIQNMLFTNQINRLVEGGTPESEAPDKAATVVARPGTSEHNTGLASDFNMASDRFESTEMFTWMKQNAADYGFILRYPKDKTDITGVIYESWHWRFVGINAAYDINKLGVTLEEYVELKGLQPLSDEIVRIDAPKN